MSIAICPQARDLASRVREDRIWNRLEALARFGALGTGVNRQALSREDMHARRYLLDEAGALGLQPMDDAVGNLYLRLEGSDPSLPPVLIGSHIDTQPTGGKYDGAYGVIAALEVLQAVREAGLTPRHPLEAVAWCNEEGSRFAPGAMGSAVFSGARALDDALACRDAGGVSVAEAWQQVRAGLPAIAERRLPCPVHAYVEPHIEQGPILERDGRAIGVVAGIQAVKWLRITVSGREAHAGTTPMDGRQDAMAAACGLIRAIYDAAAQRGEPLRVTVGRLDAAPNSPNTIANLVDFSLDVRHPRAQAVEEFIGEVERLCRTHAGPCKVESQSVLDFPPTEFHPSIAGLVAGACRELGLSHMEIVSGAFHDARFLASVCPSGMIFVPCAEGISHSLAEKASAPDLAAGARVLAAVAWTLAGQDGSPGA